MAHKTMPLSGWSQYKNLLLTVHSGNCYVRAWGVDAPIFDGTVSEFYAQHPTLYRLFLKHWPS